MQMWVLYGPDDEAVRTRRTELFGAAGAEPESADVAEDGGAILVAAVESPSLFGGIRVVAADNLEALTVDNLQRISRSAELSDAYIVARATTPTPTLVKALKAFATVEKFEAPKGASVRNRVREIAKRHSVVLTSDVERLMTERAGHDLDRVASVCTQLEIANMQKPTARQVDVLLGSCSPSGVPWAVADALERGDVSIAVDEAAKLSGIAVLAYLSGQVEQAARLCEAGVRNADEAAGVLGVSSFVAKRAFGWSKALGADGVRQALVMLGRADKAAKSSVGERDACAMAVAQLGVLRRSGSSKH